MEIIGHEYYVSSEVAELLRKAGFDWECYKVYKTDVTENLTLFTYIKEEGYRNTSEFICSAPTLDVAQRWLREVKDFHIFVEYDNSVYHCRIDHMEHIYYVKHREWLYNNAFNEFSTYEEAQEAGIKKALEIILKKYNKMIEQNHECYVSLEVANLLKEAGFDWKCINRYIKDIEVLVPCLGEANWNAAEWGINDYKSAPTLDVAQRWLREVKECFIGINPISIEYNITWQYVIEDYEGFFCGGEQVNTYEEAQEACIKKALEIILEKGK